MWQTITKKRGVDPNYLSYQKSAPGPDKIHNQMLKHLPPEEIDYLLGSKDTSLKNCLSPQYYQYRNLEWPNEPFKLSSKCSNECSMQSKGENGKTKTVGLYWPEGNTVKTTMWRQSQTNFYRPSFVSGRYSNEGPSKRWARRIHLLRHGKFNRFNIETRHLDGHKRSRNRRKNVQFHTKFPKSWSFNVQVNESLSDTRFQ